MDIKDKTNYCKSLQNIIIFLLANINSISKLKKKIDKLNLWNLCLFEKLANNYEIMGKL